MANRYLDSSGSDDFEAFLNVIKTPKVERYRLSSGSLSDFIVDTSEDETSPKCEQKSWASDRSSSTKTKLLDKPCFRVESSSSDGCVKENKVPTSPNCSKPQSSLIEASYSSTIDVNFSNEIKNSCTGNVSSNSDAKLDDAQAHVSSPQILKTKDLNSRRLTEGNKKTELKSKPTNYFTPNKLLTRPHKSVSTPIRKVVFSSDSDDEVFQPSGLAAKTSIQFSDSENEGYFKVAVEKPRMVFFSSSESDSDEPPSLLDRIKPKPLLKQTAGFCPALNGNLGGTRAHIKDKGVFNPKVQRPRGDSFESYRTPDRKAPKQFPLTEKINRSRMHCAIKGCFLTSLDLVDPKNAGKGFQRNKNDLTGKLFKLFNNSVFDNLLPEKMEVSWAKRLTKTAGITKCRRITQRKLHPEGDIIMARQYEASISLSDKVIDSASRLRDTLIHEMCHAAVWLVNNASESHGPFWKSWAAKARRAHPELPLIERCHNYDIQYKFVYQCTRCKTDIGRHSKSLDTSKKVCGRCRGKLELLPQNNQDGTRPRRANPFANFVKDNYKDTRSRIESSGLPVSHRDIMKSLSEQFKSASVS